jgi:transposase
MKFTYGFTIKTVKGKEYVYFWRYMDTGRKAEQYIGRAGQAKTERKALEVKLVCLQSLQEEIAETIRQAKAELERLADS